MNVINFKHIAQIISDITVV